MSRDKNLSFGDFVPRNPAFARAFSRRSAILKIVDEKALGTRFYASVDDDKNDKEHRTELNCG